jgi:HEAT repeat protein
VSGRADEPRAAPFVVRLAGVLAAGLVAVSCQTCAPPRLSDGELPEAIRSGRHEQAVRLIRRRIDAGDDDPALARALVVLLARRGRTGEAADAYLRHVEPGDTHAAVLLEAIVVGAFDPSSCPDPLRVLDGAGAAYGDATVRVVQRALSAPASGTEGPAREADLVGLLAVGGDDSHLEALDAFTSQSGSPAVRRAALHALARIGTPAAEQVLVSLARRFSRSQLMQRHVIAAAATNSGFGARLGAFLLESDHAGVRSRAAGLLARTRDPAATELLARAGGPEALAARVARGEAPETAVEELDAHRESLSTPLDRVRFIGLVRETGAAELAPLLCAEAATDEPGVATSAIQVLATIGSTEAAECLVEAAASDDPAIVRTALRALVDVPATGSVGDLVSLMERAEEEGDPLAAGLAAAALGRAGGDRAETALEAALESRTDRIRRAAAVALWYMGREDVIGVVEEVFEDRSGPWSTRSYQEWRLLAARPDERTVGLLERAVREGNPSLRDKVLEALVDHARPEAVFLVHDHASASLAHVPRERRSLAGGPVGRAASAALEACARRDDADGRRELLARMIDSGDAFLAAVALRNLAPADDPWATRRLRRLLEQSGDPWLRLEAVRTLALLRAAAQG